MSLILQIETATDICSVVLAQNGKAIGSVNDAGARNHASVLVPAIQHLIQSAGLKMEHIDAVAVSKGPGSYTGLRIGVATAKGICFALEKPLIAINTLESMAAWYSKQHPKNQSKICPMIDARRMEVYTALFSKTIDTVLDTQALLLDENSFSEHLAQGPVIFIGNGTDKFQKLLQGHHNALFVNNFHPNAEGMSAIALNLFQEKRFESVAYFEPFYLKDFYTPQRRL